MEMQTRHGFRTAFALLAVIVLILGVAAAVSAAGPAARPTQSRAEAQLLMTLIDERASAAEMARLCGQKASHDELSTLCKGMTAHGTQDIKTLQGWLKDWYKTAHEPQIASDDQALIRQLKGLKGEDFEVFFLSHLIEYDRMAIRQGLGCAEAAGHAALQAACKQMARGQLDEVIQLHTSLCDWYDVCDFQHQFTKPPMSNA